MNLNSLLGKILFPPKAIYPRTNIHCIEEEKLPHQSINFTQRNNWIT